MGATNKKVSGLSDVVVCCFCGVSLPEEEAVLMVLYPLPDRVESQAFYADRACLDTLFRPEVPRHAALDERMWVADLHSGKSIVFRLTSRPPEHGFDHLRHKMLLASRHFLKLLQSALKLRG